MAGMTTTRPTSPAESTCAADITPKGRYRVEVSVNEWDRHHDQYFNVTCYVQLSPFPPLTLDQVSVAPNPFYPLVRDFFKHNTTISYRINRQANVTARVYNAN